MRGLSYLFFYLLGVLRLEHGKAAVVGPKFITVEDY